MRKWLTERYLKSVKPPASGRLTVTDAAVSGLTFRLTEKDARSWLIRYRVKGEPRTPGKPPPQHYLVLEKATLGEARQRARDIVAAAKRGVDLVKQEKREAAERAAAETSARTVQELATEFIERHCKPHQRRWKATELRIKNHILPKLRNKMAGDVRRADVVEVLDWIEHDKGLRQQVNRTRSTLSAMFRYAVERQYVAENPVVGTRVRKMEVERTRILDDDELKAIWAALDRLPDPGRSFVRALMLTGARRDEARGLPWAEIDLDGALWLLPAARNKANRDFEIPLSKPMVTILRELPRRGLYVFTVHYEGKRPWSGHGPFKTALDRESGVTSWTFHDLRRTMRSRLAALHVPYEVAERVLNHAMTKIERTYNRHAYREQKAAALQAWADKLMMVVGEASKSNVVEIRTAS